LGLGHGWDSARLLCVDRNVTEVETIGWVETHFDSRVVRLRGEDPWKNVRN